MNVLSLFDGISCGRIALERAGIHVDNYYSSEIKDYAINVANINYPQDINNRLGSVLNIKGKDLPKIDLLIGGSPCQDFSFANSEIKGVSGEKSGLFYEYVRTLKECKPRYFLLENVKMKKEHQNLISKELGVEPININSSVVSPQLRNRLYWTNIPYIGHIKDKNIFLNDILENGYSNREKAKALLQSDSRPLSTPVKMLHRYFNTGFTTVIFKDKHHYDECSQHFKKHFNKKSAKEIDKMLEEDKIDVSIYDGIRYMNRREREICQTMPKGYTDSLSENRAADVLGDGWTVDVIAHILRGLA